MPLEGRWVDLVVGLENVRSEFADGWQGRAAQARQRAFWIAWLTHIIPVAWYPLADDELDGLPISVPALNTRI